MSTTATIENMREHYRAGVLAYSPGTGEEYSANPADYWDAPPGWAMLDANNEPMLLVVKVTSYQDAGHPFAVVDEETAKVLHRFATEDEAADFICTLAGADSGRYGIDGPAL